MYMVFEAPYHNDFIYIILINLKIIYFHISYDIIIIKLNYTSQIFHKVMNIDNNL